MPDHGAAWQLTARYFRVFFCAYLNTAEGNKKKKREKEKKSGQRENRRPMT